jgi:uncharacterized paraquat-inducible protein A
VEDLVLQLIFNSRDAKQFHILFELLEWFRSWSHLRSFVIVGLSEFHEIVLGKCFLADD